MQSDGPPVFRLIISNDVAVSGNIFEFDLSIYSPDTSMPFELASVQAAISMNPEIINGGVVNCIIKNNSSELFPSQRPTTVMFNPVSSTLELLPMPLPGSGSGTIISNDSLDPTRICRIRVINVVPWHTGQPDLDYLFPPEPYPTQVACYLAGVDTTLTCDSTNCVTITGNAMLNYPPPPFPAVFNISGSATYCPYDFPVSIVLDSSEVGVTYKVSKGGFLIDYLEGTGYPLLMEVNDIGDYIMEAVNASGSIPMNGMASIAIQEEPEVFISADQNSVCPGTLVTFTSGIENPGNAGSFLWIIYHDGSYDQVVTEVPAYAFVPYNADRVSLEYYTDDPCIFVAESNLLILSVHTPSEGGAVTGNTSIFLGDSTGILSLAGYSGTIVKWQKRKNRMEWQDIVHSLPEYAEIPASSGSWEYRAIVQNYDCEPDTSSAATIIVQDRILTLKVFPQGLYNPSTRLLNKAVGDSGYRYQRDTADLVTIRLIEELMPYSEVISFQGVDLPTNGMVDLPIPPLCNQYYYIVINHRNSIETWSALPVSFEEDEVFYDFTTGANKAYGYNLHLMGDAWTIYGGDINQDGLVDSDDMIRVDNSSSVFETGYLPEDADGDGLVDSSDIILVDNNSGTFVTALFPYDQELPIVNTLPASNIDTDSFQAGGSVLSQGASPVTARGICWSINLEPTLDDDHTNEGSGTGSFSSMINSLVIGTHYYFRAYATNQTGTAYGPVYSFTTLNQGGGEPYPVLPSVTYMFQTYNTVQIGSQVWLRENLNIGNRINLDQDQSDNGIIEKHCLDDLEVNCSTYGGLYTWDEMMQYSVDEYNQGVCPDGWHTPSNSEWITLVNYLGGDVVAGGEMKEIGIKHWLDPNFGATNSSGFSALPTNMGVYAGWWASSKCGTYPQANMNRYIFYDATFISVYGCDKETEGIWDDLSVRCIMNDSTKLPAVSTAQVVNIMHETCQSGGEVVPNGGCDIISRGVCWSTSPNPTVADFLTSDGSGYGAFVSYLTGLQPDTAYYIRAYAINSAGIQYGTERFFSTAVFGIPCPGLDSMVYENKIYKTVKIGDQCWMKNNLNIGVQIPGSLAQGNDSVIEKYCYNNDESKCDIFGGLYQWDEAMQYSTDQGSRGICPEGWHIPTDSEWKKLVDFLGENLAGNMLKEFGTASWKTPNSGANNESGFTALSSGQREAFPGFSYEYFRQMEEICSFWSSTELFSHYSTRLHLSYNITTVVRSEADKYNGLSIRCLKNDSLQTADVITAPISYLTQNSAQSGGNITYSGGSPVTSRGVCFDTIPNPTVSGNHTNDGDGTGAFISYLTGLYPSKTYFIRAYASNSGGIAYGNELSFTTLDTVINTSSCPGLPVVTYENQDYNTIFIDGQCWLKENLNVGNMISGSQNQSNNGIVEKYCFNDSAYFCDLYGGLYQWKEMMNYSSIPGSRGICPAGWHIPSDEDWCTLTMNIDPTIDCDDNGWNGWDIGHKMKSADGWENGGNGSNSTGFSALPAGFRQFLLLNFGSQGTDTFFWTSDSYSNYSSWHRSLNSGSNGIYRFYDSKDFGFSVRCIKD